MGFGKIQGFTDHDMHVEIAISSQAADKGDAGFALDAIQLRREAAPETRRVGDLGAMKALVKLAAAIVGSAWIGIGSVRQGRVRETPREQPSPIVVGR